MSAWKPFYFDGNSYFGHIKSPEDWQKVLAAYVDQLQWNPDFLKTRVRVNPATLRGKRVISFGLYSEYTGPLTLGAWAAQNGMSLDPPAQT